METNRSTTITSTNEPCIIDTYNQGRPLHNLFHLQNHSASVLSSRYTTHK